MHVSRTVKTSFLVFLLGSFLYGIPISTQARTGGQIKFENLSIEDGLSQVTVYTIFQDHRGFMWFGTRDGLNKYDGYKFTIYRHQPYDSTTLTHNKINCLYEDHLGLMWVGTDDGINIYNRELDSFQPFVNDSIKFSSVCNKIINTIYEDRSGNLWIGTEDGLCRINSDRTKLTSFISDNNDTESLSDNHISVIYQDRQGTIWIGTDNGLNYIMTGSDRVKRFLHQSGNPNTLCDNNVHMILEDKTGYLWIGTSNGLSRYDLRKNRFNTYKYNKYRNNSLASNTVNAILLDKNGLLWLGTDHGLSIFDSRTGNFTNFYSDLTNPFSLGDNHVYSLFADRSGIIWIGTYGGGISKYNPQMERFTHYLINQKKADHKSENFTYAFAQNNDEILWIGTNEGLFSFNRKNGRYKQYAETAGDSNGLCDDRVRSLLFDSDGKLWIGTYEGLNRFDITTGSFEVYKNDPSDKNSLSNNFVISLEEYPAGVLWIGTNLGGLNRFEIKKKKFTRYSIDNSGISSDRIFNIHADQNGYLWLGTYGGGLDRFNPGTGEVKVYMYDKNNPNSINGDFIYSIHEDMDGILWIGMYGAGLNRFDPKTDTFRSYDKTSGLQNNLIYGILEDSKKRLWMSSNRGLIRFTPGSAEGENTFRQFDIKDGLQSTEFNFGAYFKNDRGEMIFGGVNGFNIFYPDSISDHQYKAPIVLTDLEIEHREVNIGKNNVLPKSISELQQIELEAGINAITFEFSALDYSNPHKNEYAYKLIGIDPDWIYVPSSKRFAQYTNLPGGSYVLKVKGSNSDGVWNEDGVSLQVIVHFKFWETLWFKIISGFVVIGLGFLLYIVRTNNIRIRNAQLQEMNFALGKEIEERLKVEEALQHSEEKYRTITDNLHAGIYRNTPQLRGKFIEVNPTFIKMFGFDSREEVMEISAADLYNDVRDRNRFTRKIRRKGFVDKEEYLLKRKDGSTFWASVTAVAVQDEKGETAYFDGMIEDISERKRVEKALIESEEKYRILVERATDGILIIRDGIIAYANPRMAMLSGYSVDELLDSSLVAYVDKEDLGKLNAYYNARMNKKVTSSTYEILVIHKKGHRVVTEVNVSLISYEGKPADLVFIRDISMRRQFEIQLRQTHKMEAIGHLAGGVAHDFNNILTVISGHAELAQLMMTKNHRAYKHIDDVLRSSQKASDLIRQLLAFSRQQIIEPKIIDVNNVIASLDKMLHRIIGEDLQIISNLMDDLPPIKADPGQIEQVLMNLIINARDAIVDNPNQKAEKLIVIETSKAHISESYARENLETRAGEYILISIKDTGKGMGPDTIDRIFDPFFTTKEQGKGTGLGLATVFGIVKQNNGHITVDSQLNSGTIIKVYWPYSEVEPLPEDDGAMSELRIGGNETILVVEDETNVLEFTKEALESSGYRVLEATNGLEALDILKKNSRKIDLIISDVVMPKMSGQELAEEVGKRYPDLKMIMMSGYTDSQIIRSGAESQSVNFIYKPFSIKTISKKVQEILGK